MATIKTIYDGRIYAPIDETKVEADTIVVTWELDEKPRNVLTMMAVERRRNDMCPWSDTGTRDPAESSLAYMVAYAENHLIGWSNDKGVKEVVEKPDDIVYKLPFEILRYWVNTREWIDPSKVERRKEEHEKKESTTEN